MMPLAWGCTISTWVRGSAPACMGQQSPGCAPQAVAEPHREWLSPSAGRFTSVPEKQSKRKKKKKDHTRHRKGNLKFLSSLLSENYKYLQCFIQYSSTFAQGLKTDEGVTCTSDIKIS